MARRSPGHDSVWDALALNHLVDGVGPVEHVQRPLHQGSLAGEPSDVDVVEVAGEGLGCGVDVFQGEGRPRRRSRSLGKPSIGFLRTPPLAHAGRSTP